MAAAIGAGLPVEGTEASMVVDIGGGTTDVGVISLGGIVVSRTVRLGGDEIDEALVSFVKAEYSLLLGESSAERLKIAVGSAFPLVEELSERVRGRDLVTGLPKTVTIGSAEVRRAIETPVARIVDLVRSVLDVCRPSSPATSSTAASRLTGGERSCAPWTNGSRTSSACRCARPRSRCTPSPGRGPVRRGARDAPPRPRRHPPAVTRDRRPPPRPARRGRARRRDRAGPRARPVRSRRHLTRPRSRRRRPRAARARRRSARRRGGAPAGREHPPDDAPRRHRAAPGRRTSVPTPCSTPPRCAG